ncbi:MAG: 6,7-dimethyl-8-ribityllumazine synthase [Phycisphaeraceae bacterium]|nr:6,7-dimethyl-8-ribityllumazine synthase [Phycisphaeraceae bacterium]
MRPNGNKPSPSSAARLPRIAVIVSRYHSDITGPLCEGARRCYANAGGRPGRLTVVEAPGAFELVSLSAVAASSGQFGGVLAIGCIIKGETSHDRYIAQAVCQGLAQISVSTLVPVALGVLTVDTLRQARDRAGGTKGNKGEEAMEALIASIQAAALLRKPARRSITGGGRR